MAQAAAELTTLPRLLRRNAAELRDRPAIREKDRGIWQTHTWAQYYDHVRDFGLGLAALGFARDDKLSVIGDNRPRLYWAQMSAQCLGGISVPVYQDSIARELQYVWSHAEVSVIVAEDQEQVDKIISLREQLPALKFVIYDDPRHEPLPLRVAALVRGRRGARPEVRRRASRLLRGRAGQGPPRGRGHDRVYRGHHRQSQGRHAHPGQCRRHGPDLHGDGGHPA